MFSVKLPVVPFVFRNLGTEATMSALLLFFSALWSVPQLNPATRKNDNSDWWSLLRTDKTERQTTVQSREPLASNLRVLGIDLGEDLLSRAAGKLGRAQTAERGDASSGRAQVCYASPQRRSRPIHLVFESGEVTDSFYFFAGGPDWEGSDLCVKSRLVS